MKFKHNIHKREAEKKLCPAFTIASFLAFMGDRKAGIPDDETWQFTKNGCYCRPDECAWWLDLLTQDDHGQCGLVIHNGQ